MIILLSNFSSDFLGGGGGGGGGGGVHTQLSYLPKSLCPVKCTGEMIEKSVGKSVIL